MRDLIFIDTETNGLDPARHDAWDVAWWNLSTGARGRFLPQIPNVRQFLHDADLAALKVNHFVDRWEPAQMLGRDDTVNAMTALASQIWGTPGVNGPDDDATIPDHAVIVGAKPSFDWDFLVKLGNRVDVDLTPHHRMIDLGTYAVGVMGADPADPLSAARVAEALGIDPGDHSAEADVTSGGSAVLLLRAIRQAMADHPGTTAATWLREHSLYHQEPHRLIGRAPIPGGPSYGQSFAAWHRRFIGSLTT